MNGLYLAGGVVVVILALVAFIAWRSRRVGTLKSERDQARKGTEHGKKALGLDEKVDRLSDDELDRQLRGDPD